MSESITVVGNITEPEPRTTETGLQIVNFRLASTERRFDKETGGWIEGETSWYSVSAFRQLADHALRSFRKGDRVLVTGRLRVRDWEAGEKKGTTAQIDAEALGHDLRWGTSAFHRVSPASSVEPAKDPWNPDTQTSDGWATTPPAVAGDASSGEDDENRPAPALAGAPADSPF